MKKTSKNITDFLIRNTPEEVIGGLTVLEKLKLPLHDKKEFQEQLNNISEQGDEVSGPVIRRMRVQFGAGDFPILSLENAFEKFWDKFQPFPFPVGGFGPVFEIPPGDFRQQPSVCEVYDETFGRGTLAANCACRSYAEARRGGLNHYQAVIFGHRSGEKAARTGECEV